MRMSFEPPADAVPGTPARVVAATSSARADREARMDSRTSAVMSFMVVPRSHAESAVATTESRRFSTVAHRKPRLGSCLPCARAGGFHALPRPSLVRHREQAVEAIPRPIRVDPEPELRRDDDLVADGRERLSHQLLVRERTVSFRGVEERDAAL